MCRLVPYRKVMTQSRRSCRAELRVEVAQRYNAMMSCGSILRSRHTSGGVGCVDRAPQGPAVIAHKRGAARRGAHMMFRIISVALVLFGATAAHADRRLAFVVGIDRYNNLGPEQQLQRAVNDAKAVSAALALMRFEVTTSTNVNRAGFNGNWQKFLNKISPGDTAAIYFAGHGVEIEGNNFLLPRDVPNIMYGRQEQLKRESLSVSELLLDLRKRTPQVIVLILDACRNHPLIPPEQRSSGREGGLARMDAPAGTFIMYSAGAGETALDRLPGNDPDKSNSIYTRKLLPLMRTPGLPLHELARELRREVHNLAATVPHVQQPAYYDGLIGKFCLAGCESVTAASKPNPSSPAVVANVPTPKPLCADAERKHSKNEGLTDEELACILNRQGCTTVRLGEGGAYTVNGVTSIAQGEETLLCSGAGKREWFKDCPECPEMVVVPAGSFTMGSSQNEQQRYNEEAQVRVSVPTPFAAGRFAVTFDEWDACVSDGGCNGYKPSDAGWGRGKHPVVNVNWNDAKGYAAWLSRKTGNNYRLLSDAEREYVTRAGTTTPFWWGSSITPTQANYNGSAAPYEGGGSQGEFCQRTMPVDSFEANHWGLFNVHGNVWEWTEDCWGITGNPGNGSAWTTGDCSKRVIRGGSWSSFPQNLRSALRDGGDAISRLVNRGFRVARTLGP